MAWMLWIFYWHTFTPPLGKRGLTEQTAFFRKLPFRKINCSRWRKKMSVSSVPVFQQPQARCHQKSETRPANYTILSRSNNSWVLRARREDDSRTNGDQTGDELGRDESRLNHRPQTSVSDPCAGKFSTSSCPYRAGIGVKHNRIPLSQWDKGPGMWVVRRLLDFSAQPILM